MPTTVYSDALAQASAGTGGGSSCRFFTNSTLASGSLGQVRVQFKAASTTSLTVNHAAVTIKGSATAPNTQNTPTELKFSGSSGFNIGASASITSDWATLAFTSSDSFVIIMDFGANSDAAYDDTTASMELYYNTSDASYANATVSGYTDFGIINIGIALIETRAAPAASSFGFNMPMLGW